MLFEAKIDPRCAYCQRCAQLDEETMICLKKGPVPRGFSCRSFQYDPLKRVPARAAEPDFSKLTDEEFVL